MKGLRCAAGKLLGMETGLFQGSFFLMCPLGVELITLSNLTQLLLSDS